MPQPRMRAPLQTQPPRPAFVAKRGQISGCTSPVSARERAQRGGRDPTSPRPAARAAAARLRPGEAVGRGVGAASATGVGVRPPRRAPSGRHARSRRAPDRRTPPLGSPTSRRTRRSRQPGRMPGREQTLEELLRDVDRDSAAEQTSHSARASSVYRRTDRCPCSGATQCPQKPADRNADQQHDPRHQRMQIRMPLPRQLSARPRCRTPT